MLSPSFHTKSLSSDTSPSDIEKQCDIKERLLLTSPCGVTTGVISSLLSLHIYCRRTALEAVQYPLALTASGQVIERNEGFLQI